MMADWALLVIGGALSTGNLLIGAGAGYLFDRRRDKSRLEAERNARRIAAGRQAVMEFMNAVYDVYDWSLETLSPVHHGRALEDPAFLRVGWMASRRLRLAMLQIQDPELLQAGHGLNDATRELDRSTQIEDVPDLLDRMRQIMVEMEPRAWQLLGAEY